MINLSINANYWLKTRKKVIKIAVIAALAFLALGEGGMLVYKIHFISEGKKVYSRFYDELKTKGSQYVSFNYFDEDEAQKVLNGYPLVGERDSRNRVNSGLMLGLVEYEKNSDMTKEEYKEFVIKQWIRKAIEISHPPINWRFFDLCAIGAFIAVILLGELYFVLKS